ncbi:hypothetical protein [Amycolatopsis tolypomycina]|uniref:Secreted protein n=1 Tax=Amycolatopsis tolypomycina TaxID=208445 RepID=A0A1H5AHY0_9PSEU|nr:hypothetical protein [Amycolatopsis tolypomycina]SED41983.1 hypothetical protein SAMN04489727_7797 [Amycolatopsis tolypomycina]
MRKLFTAAAVVSLALGAVVAGPAGVASATAGQCTGGTNGFRDMPDSSTGMYATGFVVNAETNPVYFTLYYATVDGKQRGWAHLAGKTSPAGSDRFWMDWAGGPVSPWLQCGPFPNNRTGASATTPAMTTAPSYQFRVCGSVYPDPTVRCSSWW